LRDHQTNPFLFPYFSQIFLELGLSFPNSSEAVTTKAISMGLVICRVMKAGSDGPVVMSGREAESFVVQLLAKQGPLSTMEVEKLARKQHKRCPDQTVLFLTKMKKKGLIKGEVSYERRGWVWWVEDHNQ